MSLSTRFHIVGVVCMCVALAALDLQRLSTWELAIVMLSLSVAVMCAHAAGVTGSDASPRPSHPAPSRKYCEMCECWFLWCRHQACPYCGDRLVVAPDHAEQEGR